MSEYDNGVPPITAPWPVKDVSRMCPPKGPCLTIPVIDRLCIHNQSCHDRGFPRMVPLARSFSLLSSEGLSKSRTLEYQGSGSRHDVPIYSLQVR